MSSVYFVYSVVVSRRRMLRLLSILVFASFTLHAADPVEIKIWPEGAPGQMTPPSPATQEFLRTKAGKTTITNIHEPTLTVFHPAKPNGTSVIVAPGGGYVFLSAVHEGTQVCEWLTTLGVTGILLKYRTPTRDEAAAHEKPVADAAQAIKLVRQKAAEWHLDPKRIGLLGFSAGGNLLAHLACDRDMSNYPVSYDDTRGGVPNFGIMIYGGGFVEPTEPTRLKKDFAVPFDAPPMFLVCANDDGVNPLASTALYLEFKKKGIPCELHLFSKGGHGFGIRAQNLPINAWPQRCAEWMEELGISHTVAGLEKRLVAIDRRIMELLRLGALGGGLDDCGVYHKELEETSKRLSKAKSEGNPQLSEALMKKVIELQKHIDEMAAASDEIAPLRNELKACKQKRQELEDELNRLSKIHTSESISPEFSKP
jgi:acetyl esterase/lipase